MHGEFLLLLDVIDVLQLVELVQRQDLSFGDHVQRVGGGLRDHRAVFLGHVLHGRKLRGQVHQVRLEPGEDRTPMRRAESATAPRLSRLQRIGGELLVLLRQLALDGMGDDQDVPERRRLRQRGVGLQGQAGVHVRLLL